MNPWDTGNGVEILTDFNEVMEEIGIREIEDFGTMYFHDQMARYYYTLNIIYNYCSGDAILDIGNYPCHLHKILLNKGLNVDGVDIRPERIPDRLVECREKTIVWDIENEKPSEDLLNKYDVVLLLEVIEHLHVNPLNLLSSLSSILKLNGLLLLSTPNLLSLNNRINMLLGRQTFEHPFSVFENLERHGSRGHQRVYSEKELIDMLEVFGFEIQHIWAMDYKAPLLSLAQCQESLPMNFDYDYFNMFWREKKSIKGRLRRSAELALNKVLPNLCDCLFILAKRTGEYNKELFFRKIAEADPWMDMDKYNLKV